jgi:glycosyltransferase involved in cell wall biosynthesis
MRLPVTVAVTTYQSAPFIIETLESIYKQTYDNVLLVISDDASTDNTLELVHEWVAQERNRNRFKDIEVITVPKNTGVAANCNRMIAATKTDWVKSIAGDDILLPNCLDDNMAFVEENPGVQIIFSQVKVYQDDFQENNYVRTTPIDFPNNLMHPERTAFDQYQILLVNDRIHYTPSYFFNKQAVQKVGGYDETGRFIEDYPMWLKLTQTGERLYYFHKPTVGYRIHSQASNNVGSGVLFMPAVIKSFAMRQKLAHPFLPWEIGKSEHFVYGLSVFFKNMGWNKNTKLYSSLYRLGSFYLNPFHYIYAIKKRMPANKNNPFYL